MKLNTKTGAALALFFLFFIAAVISSENILAFDCPPDWNGEPMTLEQGITVAVAIIGINAGPPDSISWEDEQGNTHTASCSTIAAQLANEMGNGDIQQEVQNNDASGWEYEGEINIDDDLLNDVYNDPSLLPYLQEILIHEWVHKQQEGIEEFLRCTECEGNEVEATDAELAYKDSIGIPSTNPEYQAALNYKQEHYMNYLLGMLMRDLIRRLLVDDLMLWVLAGEEMAPDICFTYHWGDPVAQPFSFAPLQCTDIQVLEHCLPNGNSLLLACGFVPGMGGRLQSFEVGENGILGPFTIQDFPQMFYSMERVEFDNSWVVLDSAARQLYRMEDVNGDLIPEVITGIYASAAMFPQIENMRSVETAIHPVFGPGLIVNPEPARQYHAVRPYDLRWFLVDNDGNHMADVCLPARRCEFMHVIPQIREIPYAGDHTATIFGTWQHNIGLFTCDSTGEILMEMLGMVPLMDSIKVTMPLVRPLMAGEYIIPQDMMTGQRSGRAQPVRDLAPEALVIRVETEPGLLHLEWQPVPGAIEYAIWSSDNGVEFIDTGLRTPENHFELPLPPFERQFFRVTAIR